MVCALLLGSCVKDKGNYDYTDVDSPVWGETIPSEYRLNSGDNLDLAPSFTTSHPERGATYSYLWYRIVNASKYELLDETGPVLHLRSIVKGDRYLLVVRNDQTGTLYKYPHPFSVSIVNTMQKGWIYVVQKGNDVELEMLAQPTANYAPKWFLVKDLIENTADKSLQLQYKDRKAVGVISVNNIDQMPLVTLPYTIPREAMFVLTDKGAEMFSPTTFETRGPLSKYVATTSPYLSDGDVIPTRMVTTGFPAATQNYYSSAFYWNGNWFWNSYVTSVQVPFESPANIPASAYYDPKGQEFDVSDQVANLSQRQMLVMWSPSKQQFLVKQGNSGTDASVYTTSRWLVDGAAAEGEMKVSGVDALAEFKVQVPGRELIHMWVSGSSISSNPTFYAIVKDPGNVYRMLNFNATGVAVLNKTSWFTFPTTSNIANAKLFTTDSSNKYLYYTTAENKIYAFSLDGSNGEKELTGLVPAGENIVIFKNFYSEYASSADFHLITTNPSKPENERCTHTVFVSVSQSTPDLRVKLYDAASMPEVAEPEKDIPMRFTGLGDVVDFAMDDR